MKILIFLLVLLWTSPGATQHDWSSYDIGQRQYPHKNLAKLQPIIETVALETGLSPSLIAGVVAYETGAKVRKSGKSLRGGTGNRFWGPMQVGCGGGPGTYSWIKLLRRWMSTPNLTCKDLLDPYIGITAGSLVLRYIWFESQYEDLIRAARRAKDTSLLKLLRSKTGPYWHMMRTGKVDGRFELAVYVYEVNVPVEKALAFYHGGHHTAKVCRRKKWNCTYIKAVMKWASASEKQFHWCRSKNL